MSVQHESDGGSVDDGDDSGQDTDAADAGLFRTSDGDAIEEDNDLGEEDTVECLEALYKQVNRAQAPVCGVCRCVHVCMCVGVHASVCMCVRA